MRVYDGYAARWRGAEYEASPDGSLLRIYTEIPTPGFDQVAPGRYRRLVAVETAEWFGYIRTTGTWRGLPVLVLTERDEEWLVCLENPIMEDERDGVLTHSTAADPGAARGLAHRWVKRLEVDSVRRDLIRG